MPHVLIVDDEEVLRSSMARGVAKMEGFTVSQAGSLDEALGCLDSNSTDLIVSDIDMPERSGIELLGELGKRGLSIPVIFVSAYLKAFRAQIPRHGNIEAVEKPLPLDELRGLIADKLASKGGHGEPAPFSVPDYLQLACMGRHSVVIEARWPNGSDGQVVVHAGDVWSARAGRLVGREAFAQVAFRPGAHIQCRKIDAPTTERNLEGSAEGLLMDCARLLDEGTRDIWDADLSAHGPSSIPVQAASASLTEAEETAQQVFERHSDRGIEALLQKDYAAAWEAFSAAHAINPEDPVVAANLQRLHDMGHGESAKDET